MAPWPLLILAGALTGFEAEQDGVAIRVEVAANLYTWTVTNLSADPITSFAIDVHHSYDYLAPDGWDSDGPMPAGEFRAWTSDESLAIKPRQSASFSVRVKSRGAILGTGVATLGLSRGEPVVIPNVWRPVPESQRTRAVVVFGICALATLHVIGGMVRARRTKSSLSAS